MKPTLKLERSHGGMVAGMDEAGRGPWAGPVVSCCLIFHRPPPKGIHDSKQLTRETREELFERIQEVAYIGIGSASVMEIDTINILAATKLSMQRALEQLGHLPDTVLVDGNQPPQLPCRTVAVIGGDALSLSIAAASIIAKVTRDRLMCALSEQHPHYGWERNAGYGTKAHQDGLARHGVCPEHRTSYAPIRAYLAQRAEA